jgi:hypothetical protein
MRKSMQYLAVIGVVLLGGIVIGDGFVKTRHAEQSTSTLRATISAMSIQQLARELRDCDPPPGLGPPPNHDAAFCAEVMRVIEDRPLQAVDTEHPAPPPLPALN